MLLLALSPPLWALIPGIAPGLVALLPQLIVIVLAMLGLLVSPRSWWRFARFAFRHPGRVFGTLLVLSTVVFASFQAGLLRGTAPASLPAIPGGFPPGDRHASGSSSSGAGPLSPPQVIPVEEGAANVSGEWIALHGKAFSIEEERGRILAFDPGLRLSWERTLDAPLACRPLVFERRSSDGRLQAGLVILTARSEEKPAALIIVDVRDASSLCAEPLPGPPRTAAIVDERLLIVFEESLSCFTIEEPTLPRRLWTRKRPRRDAIAIAGDECGRYYLLDAAELIAGDLDGTTEVRLAAYTAATPRALALHHGLAYVLAVHRDGARLECLDPALAARRPPESPQSPARSPVRWSRSVPAPLGGRIVIGSAGIVLTLPDGIALIDPSTGVDLRRTGLHPGLLCPAAVASGSCFALLSDRTVVRLSLDTGSVEWKVPEVPGSSSPLSHSSPSLTACGSHLIVDTGSGVRVLARSSGGSGSWSHWRGGPSRRGAADDAEAPLTGRVLWRRSLEETPAPGKEGLPASGNTGSILPVGGGCIVLRPGRAASRVHRVLSSGDVLGTEVLEGEARGIIADAERVFVAIDGDEGGRVLSWLEGSAVGPPRTRLSWRSPLPSGPRRDAIAAFGERLFVCLEDRLRALGIHDGSIIWDSLDVSGGTAPIVADGLVYTSCGGEQGMLIALDVASGRTRWRRSVPGWRGGPATLMDDRVLVMGASGAEARLLALSARDGSTLWEAATGTALMDAAITGSHSEILLGFEDGATLVLSPGGRLRGRAPPGPAGSPRGARLVGVVGACLIADSSGIHCFDTLALEPMWGVDLERPAEDIVFHEGRALVLTEEALWAVGAE